MVVPTRAPDISFIERKAACLGFRLLSSSSFLLTFSVTTNHQDHKTDGQRQGFYHFDYRGPYKGGVIDRVGGFEPFRKNRPEFFHTILDPLYGFQSVGAGRQLDGNARGGLSLVTPDDTVAFRAYLDPGDVAERYL